MQLVTLLSRAVARLSVVMLVLVAFISFSGCEEARDAPTVDIPATNLTLLDQVTSSADFDILEAAAVRAGASITGLLGNRNGSLTLLAPTDAAFIAFLQAQPGAPAGLTESTAITFLNTLPADNIARLLNKHVLSTRRGYSELPNPGTVLTPRATGATPFPGRLFGRRNPLGAYYLNEAVINSPDVRGVNGLLQYVNDVLDTSTALLTPTVVANTSLDILEAALVRANLANTFTGEGPWTVFAPTDTAFVSFLAATFPGNGITDEATAITFVNGADPAALTPILQRHVLGSNRYMTREENIVSATGVAGWPRTVSTLNSATNLIVTRTSTANWNVIGGGTIVSNVLTSNVLCSNGVAHVISRVIR